MSKRDSETREKIEQYPNYRICPECGIRHNCVLENTSTGEVEKIFDKCRGCLLGFGPKGHLRNGLPELKEQITLNDN